MLFVPLMLLQPGLQFKFPDHNKKKICTKLQENKKAEYNDRMVKILHKLFKGGKGTEFTPKKVFACQVGAFELE